MGQRVVSRPRRLGAVAALVVTAASLAAGLTAREARAQFVFTNDTGFPDDVVGFRFSGGGSPALAAIPNAAALLGTLDSLGRWTVGDLDRDGNPEVVGVVTILANQPEVSIQTFDVASGAFITRTELILSGEAGRQFTGDVDGDGRDELLLTSFGDGTPMPRPATGGTDTITVVHFDALSPLATRTFTIPNQFITRNSQFVARDITGDRAADILVLSQDTVGQTSGGEPTGPATLFACSPVLSNPGTCTEIFTAQIPASAGGRFPTSIDVADVDGDTVLDVLIGYGSSCQITDLGVFVVPLDTGVGIGPLPLPRPFQHVAAADLDGDGTAEVVATTGGQSGVSGSIQVYRFERAASSFTVLAETPVNLPRGAPGFPACQPSIDPANTFDPAATVGLVPPVAANDICNNMDDDGDGDVDENCFMKFLFIPMCFRGNDDQFRARTQAHVDFFRHSLGLDACPDNVLVEQISKATYQIEEGCDPDYRIGDFPFDIQTALTALGHDIDDWTMVVAFTDDQDFPANDPSGTAGLTYPSIGRMLYVKDLAPTVIGQESGATYRLIPEHVFSHEFGHQAGFDEEYVGDGGGLNPLEARLGCDITDGSCCEPNTLGDTCYLMGNRSRFGNGRCIMASALAEAIPEAPATPRDWCENCFHHLKQLDPVRAELVAPLSCQSAFNANGPIISLSGSVSQSGGSPTIVPRLRTSARLPLGAPFEGDLHLRVETGAGAAFYEARFRAQAFASEDLPPPALPPAAGDRVPFALSATIPQGVSLTDKMAVVIAKGGIDVSRSTVNGAAPTANAGPDQMLECGASFQLDGRASSDPDGDTLTYQWTGATLMPPDGATPIGRAPFGDTTISLVVSDGIFASAADQVVLHAADTAAPDFDAPREITVVACGKHLRKVEIPPPAVREACDPDKVRITGTIIASHGKPLHHPVPLVDGRAPIDVLDVGRHVIRWKAVDGVGLKDSFDQTVIIEPCWPMFRRVAPHWGASPLPGPGTDELRWTRDHHRAIESSPAVGADGRIFFGSEDGKVRAVSADGSELWSTPLGGPVSTSPAIGIGGVVYVAFPDGDIAALDPDDGRLLCRTPPPHHGHDRHCPSGAHGHGRDGSDGRPHTRDRPGKTLPSSPAIGQDGTVYVGSNEGALRAIDRKDCGVIWSFSTDDAVHSTPAVGPRDRVYFGDDGGRVYALSKTGARLWSAHTGGDVDSSPALSRDGAVLFVASDDGFVRALDAERGAERWRTRAGGRIDASPAVAFDGTIVIGTGAGTLLALDAGDGHVRWSRDLGAPVRASAAIGANGTVYVAAGRELVALTGDAGQTLWSFRASADVVSSPAIGSERSLYLADLDGNLYALGARADSGCAVAPAGRHTPLGLLAALLLLAAIARFRPASPTGDGPRTARARPTSTN